MLRHSRASTAVTALCGAPVLEQLPRHAHAPLARRRAAQRGGGAGVGDEQVVRLEAAEAEVEGVEERALAR